jgi:ribonuclease HI
MDKNKIIIFTDGSASGNPGPGGWGAIVACPPNQEDLQKDPQCEEQVLEIGGREVYTTNNRMELKAVIQALKSLDDIESDVIIHTDSSYVVQGITQWVKNWANQNWLTATKKPVLNQDLWQELIAIVEKREKLGMLTWKLIEGHAGIPANERVDTIATAFTNNRTPDLYKGPRSKYPVNLLSLVANRTKKVVKDRKRSQAKAYSYISMVNGKIEIHATWAECEARVKGVRGTRFKKALSKEEEGEIIKEFSK